MSRQARERRLAVGKQAGERRLVRDERPDLLGMPLDEREAVHGTAAAGEEIDGSAADRVDESMQVVRLLLDRVARARRRSDGCVPRPAGRT